jgi:hypothetical protein
MTTIICLLINCLNVCNEIEYKPDGTYKIISQKVVRIEKNCKAEEVTAPLPPLPPLPKL